MAGAVRHAHRRDAPAALGGVGDRMGDPTDHRREAFRARRLLVARQEPVGSRAGAEVKGPLAWTAWMINEDFAQAAMADLEPQPPTQRMAHLRPSGFIVMRSGWEPGDRYAVFQYGWADSGHAYPGALSLSLMMNEEIIATNPGSPRSYRHPAYAYCHSTPAHNTVSIDGGSYVGGNGIAPGGKLLRLEEREGSWFIQALHEGYVAEFGATHERRMLVTDDGPVVWWDRIVGGAGHVARWHFHTPLKVSLDAQGRAHLQGRGEYTLAPVTPITPVEHEAHWAAVLPRDCQPDDCGKPIPALAWVQPITDDGAEFVMVLAEGTGLQVVRRGPGLLDVTCDGGHYCIRLEDYETDNTSLELGQ